MCGIFFTLNTSLNENELNIIFNRSSHRGPDKSVIKKYNENMFFGFHRLSIMDISDDGMQPFENQRFVVICNGEIYNYLELQNSTNHSSKSDCECILDVFENYSVKNLKKLFNNFDAEFAMIVYDKQTNDVIIGRDPFGVRPLYYGIDTDNNELYVSSEMKSIPDFIENVRQFPPGHYTVFNSNTFNSSLKFVKYYKDLEDTYYVGFSQMMYSDVRNLLTKAVQKRTMGDRKIGCLLSGGLDSSIIASILIKYIPNLQVFSVGFEGSVDIIAAKKVAKYLGIPSKNHHIVNFDANQGISIIEEVIQQIETYDITTIRASIPQYLLSKYIKENTDITVLFSGEGSDELTAGYAYFKNAPSLNSLQEETKIRLEELHCFDNLRTDRTTAKFGLEVRIPFLDKDFVNYYFHINPEYKFSSEKHIEKYILRKAFEGYLPTEILMRPKEAFSDAVSSKKDSWIEILKETLSNINFDNLNEFEHNTPKTKEALYYRNIFEKYYNERSEVLPHYWMPNWNPYVIDPSATVLKCYSGDLN